jgi:putative redox protein
VSHRTVVKHLDGLAFQAELQGHKFTLDGDPGHGGRGLGPTPKPLVLTALAGCTGMDVASLLARMRVSFDSFQVEVDGDVSCEHPVVYTEIRVRYVFSGAQLDREKIEKAVRLSRQRYCGVFAMLDKAAHLTCEIVTSP